MKILIIGGTGNISTPITHDLIAQGHQVYLVNRGSHLVEGTQQVISDRRDHDRFEQQMKALLAKTGGMDCVIDMVAYQVEDARSLIRAFRGSINQLIFCSTVDVYTKPACSYPVLEDFERKPNPAFEYAYQKAQMEDILFEANQRGDFHLTVLRPAATYNDGGAPISPIGSGLALLRRIREGKPILVLGDGTSFWASSHRDDVAKSFVAAVGSPHTFGKAYHLTADEWMTWQAYYETAARVLGAPPISFVPIPADLLARITLGAANWSSWNFKYNNIFDNSASKADLRYCYTITWEEGVRRMVAFHDSRGNIARSITDPLYDRVIDVFQNHAAQMERELAA